MSKTFYVIFSLLGGIILLFIIAPVAGLFINTTSSDLIGAVKNPEVTDSIWLTIWTSIAATLLFAVSSIPLAYILARKNFPLKRLVLSIINLPIIIPHSAAGIALLSVMARGTVVGNFFEMIGFDIIGSRLGIILAMAFVSVPFLLNSAIDGFASVPVKYEYAAMSLGASNARVFFTVSLPLAWRHIVTGLTMMWSRGMSEFGAVIIITYHPMITPVMIFEQFNNYGLQHSRSIAALFILVCLLVYIITRIVSKKQNNVRN